MLKPRRLLSDAIDPDKCEDLPTAEERHALLQRMLDACESSGEAAGAPCSCGPLQASTFGYKLGSKIGLHTTAEASSAYNAGSRRHQTIGECRRRGCNKCSTLNFMYSELAPGTSKTAKGTLHPPTSTGEVFSYTFEPLFLQMSCEVETINYNPMQCLFLANYHMDAKGNLQRHPHCYDPTEYIESEQRLMDFVRRYCELPNRRAYVESRRVLGRPAVVQRLLFTPETKTGTACGIPSTSSPGEPDCHLVFPEVKIDHPYIKAHPTFVPLLVRVYAFKSGGVEIEVTLKGVHISQLMAGAKTSAQSVS